MMDLEKAYFERIHQAMLRFTEQVNAASQDLFDEAEKRFAALRGLSPLPKAEPLVVSESEIAGIVARMGAGPDNVVRFTGPSDEPLERPADVA